MKSEHTIQLLLSGMLTWIGSKFQTFGMLILSLLFLMIIDYITGMLASRLGILKKTGCWLVIGSAFSVDGLLHNSASSLGIVYPSHFYLGVFITVWYSLNELLSIIENAGRMGVPIPQKLKKYISVLKKELNDKDSLP